MSYHPYPEPAVLRKARKAVIACPVHSMLCFMLQIVVDARDKSYHQHGGFWMFCARGSREPRAATQPYSSPITAMASISTSQLAASPACTVLRAGGSVGKNSR